MSPAAETAPIADAVAQAWRRVAGAAALVADAPLDPPDTVSYRLLRVVFHLEAALGRSLPPELFRNARRPSEFAARLAASPPASPSHVAPPALFLLPGMGGDDPALMRLRTHLRGLAIAVIDTPDWPETETGRFDFAALIDHAVRRVQALAPAGPLRLAGYSLGGHLAYAVSLRLTALGRSVACLGIIDSSLVTVPRWAPFWSPSRLINFLAAASHGRAVESAANFLAKLLWRLAPGRTTRLTARRLSLPLDLGFFLRRALITELMLRAFRPWLAAATARPVPLDAAAVLFRSASHQGDAPADLGWRRCCPRLRVALLRGDHHGLLDPANLDGFCAAFLSGMGLSGMVPSGMGLPRAACHPRPPRP